MSYPWLTMLIDAKKHLMANLDKGMICPCCGQFAKRYRRNITSGMARSLIKYYRYAKFEWQHLPTTRIRMNVKSHDDVFLAYWGLLEEATEKREDGGRAGWWRVTPKGEQFVKHWLRVPKYAIVFNAICERMDDSDGYVNIQDCLGDDFDLRDLMR